LSEIVDSRREMIAVERVWAGYHGQVVLEDVSLSVKEGDFVGLIGPNGGGKTTLLRVILGLLTPYRGTVRLLGKPVREGRKYVGYVPQGVEFDHDFPINVWQVVQMGRLGKRGLVRRYRSEDDGVVAEALRSVDMLNQRNRPLGELSGGQRQRVYIARALATEAQVLLLDEPATSVDPQVSASIYELLQELNQEMAILMVTHDMAVVSAYIKSVGCLNRRLFYHGDEKLTSEILEEAYQCPVEMIAHGVPHRVFADHEEQEP
jgi:zinc transport system ATP-binding protein